MRNVHESLDRRHVQLLAVLAQTGQLAMAADVLAITASAASHRLAEAERRVGAALTEREGRGLRLTASGQHLADVATAADAALRSAEETARWLGTSARPSIRFGLSFYDCGSWLRSLVGGLGLPAPVDLVRVPFGAARQGVARRTVDLAIDVIPAGGSAPDGGGHLLATDRLMAIVAPDHPAVDRRRFVPSDVVDASYLTAGRVPTTGFEHGEFFAPAGALPAELVMVESTALILELVAERRGLTIQPSAIVDPASPIGASVAAVSLEGPGIPVEWWAFTADDRSEEVDAVLAAVAEGLAAACAQPELS